MKQFKTESKRVLDLMINSIYTNKEIFLRELISNASDAIDKRRFLSLTDKNAAADFKIEVTADKEKRALKISDNGIGMSEEELEKNLGTIAESGTLKFKKENEDEKELIGQFGVGFYSAFMVADKIEVLSKKYGEEKAHLWKSSGVEGYTIEEAVKPDFGTEITVYLKADDEDKKYSDFLEEYEINSLIKKYSDYIRYPILTYQTEYEKEGEERKEKTVLKKANSMIPVWKRPKAEVTDETLSEFYKSEFYDYEEPLKSVYSKIEGAVNYDSIIYIPKHAPFDYYSKDFKRGLKLFANGVLIMEKCDTLLPEYFGFCKGIIDSEDLSLNISRELLQQDRQVKAIANGIEKKILSTLEEMKESDRENYEKFFEEFGLGLKFGIYANFGAKKDTLKDLIMFYSGKEKKLVTLSDYVSKMGENDKEIFYATGETYEKIDALPQVEKVKEKGFDILYLKDQVDEFVLKILGEYKEKTFKSVSEANFSIETDEEKENLKAKSEKYADLIKFVKEELKDKVKDVKLSLNLKSYPACLTSSGELSIEMEKVINSVPGNKNKVYAEKIFELNAEHTLTDKLYVLLKTDKEKLKTYIAVLYNEARLIEGLEIENVGEFVGKINEIIK